MLFNKKASLEISIQAIVIVVLAMTLLGLGLGFVRNLFKNIGSATEDVTEQVRQKVLDDLISSDKKVSFPKTDISIDKGDSTVLTVGIRNKKDTPLHYQMRFTSISFVPADGGSATTVNNQDWFQTGQSVTATRNFYTLGPAESDVRNIRLKVPTTALAGSYVLTFDVLDIDSPASNNIYAQKDFFIVVRG